MEGGISAPFIRHPIATSLLMVGILFAGIVAYPRLPVAPLPQVDFPTIQVSAQLPGAARRLFLQSAQDVNVGGRASRTQFQYTMQSSDLNELNQWAPKMLVKMQALPGLRDVASDQQTEGTTLTLAINRDQASRYGLTAQAIDDTLYDAFGQRQIAQYFTQLSSYVVIMEALSSLQGDVATLDKIFIFLKSPTTGGEVPLLLDDNADPTSIH